MKYEVTTDEEGKITLTLGEYSAIFKRNFDVKEIVAIVENLIQLAVGVSAFELVTAVLTEANKQNG